MSAVACRLWWYSLRGYTSSASSDHVSSSAVLECVKVRSLLRKYDDVIELCWDSRPLNRPAVSHRDVARHRQRLPRSSAPRRLQRGRQTVGDRAFPVAGSTIWNSLPHNVISAPSLSTFRQRLKTFKNRPCSLTLSLIPGKLFPTSIGSWSDFITWTTLKIYDWLIDGKGGGLYTTLEPGGAWNLKFRRIVWWIMSKWLNGWSWHLGWGRGSGSKGQEAPPHFCVSHCVWWTLIQSRSTGSCLLGARMRCLNTTMTLRLHVKSVHACGMRKSFKRLLVNMTGGATVQSDALQQV